MLTREMSCKIETSRGTRVLSRAARRHACMHAIDAHRQVSRFNGGARGPDALAGGAKPAEL